MKSASGRFPDSIQSCDLCPALRQARDNRRMPGQLRIIRHPTPAGVNPGVHQLVLTAIHEKRLLRFAYHGKLRVVEPQDYGIQNGTAHLFSFQIGGQSSSGPLPDWRKFAVRDMSKLELLEQTFPGSRAVPWQRHHEWDVLFARVS
jgi:hypothetical protein